MHLCVQDLAELTGGKLRLAEMPPVEGAWQPVGPIVTLAEAVEPGDLFWCLKADGACDLELAFCHGVNACRLGPWDTDV